MKIILHIGTEATGALALQSALHEKREQLAAKGVLYARSVGKKNHARLFMAVTDPDQVDPLRFNRGFILEDKQRALREEVASDLAREAQAAGAEVLILSMTQAASALTRVSELETLRDLLRPISDDISLLMHVGEQASAMARAYAAQVMEGRATSLAVEQGIGAEANWWQACLEQTPEADPLRGSFPAIQRPLFWLDYATLQAHWEGVFGAGSLTFRPYLPEVFHSEAITEEIRAAFGIEDQIGRGPVTPAPGQEPAATLTRARQMNDLLLAYLGKHDAILPRQLWMRFLREIAVDGPVTDPATLSGLCTRFAAGNAALVAAHPALEARHLALPAPDGDWVEADPMFGYRASQYLLSFRWRIAKATKEERDGKIAEAKAMTGEAPAPQTDATPAGTGLSPEARAILPPEAVARFDALKGGAFAPHNRLGQVDEEAELPPYDPIAPRDLPEGNSGRVVLGCMKNEAPYILEWVAYHRAVGFDNFLIYTNDCSDGTAEILDRLQELGVVQHRNNDNWKGNSPQQWALDSALEEPVIRNSEWIAHFDVDEFVNIRCGNGTLDDFFARVPDATNIAMTWRLFGHNGVTTLKDDLVIAQFDHAAPKFCPKPHTVWGFKTMFRNMGAYQKISCHRPNKLSEEAEGQVHWVNGSGQPMTKDVLKNGWRSSKKTVGYDLLQLNHYALRSAESYLVKRQRGRALHVDRSIGLNYWVRMDWSDNRDVTIQRNIPRVREELARLLADDRLRALHESGFAWHRAKAAELHGMPEFEELYTQALQLKLTETERVAYALALDVES
ncbi:glycosyltransferase family 2 protein [Ferrimonas balearica]|nr:glycosyltransferase family 2 protein [Ferrimonas balearica]